MRKIKRKRNASKEGKMREKGSATTSSYQQQHQRFTRGRREVFFIDKRETESERQRERAREGQKYNLS
jgi:hypothetical protein